jgi:hypothetical protein
MSIVVIQGYGFVGQIPHRIGVLFESPPDFPQINLSALHQKQPSLGTAAAQLIPKE